ncbi:MAG: VCBS repeat-containing protein [Planctomycetales bacterium]|nr:VCBS repeat-containing protein [Planctomycetales bacterium]
MWQTLAGGHATRNHLAFDADGDGDLDLLELNYGEQNRLLLNNGSGEFTDGTDPLGLSATGIPSRSDLSRCAVAVDVDGDGDPDVVVGNEGQNRLYRNNGAGEFTDGTDLAQVLPFGLPAMVDDTRALVALDVDGDGDRDLIVGNIGQDQLLLNDGSGEFLVGTDILGVLTTGLPAAADPTTGIVAADLDGDGDTDLATSNDAGASARLLLNSNGAGEFVDSTFAATTGLPYRTDPNRALVLGNLDGSPGTDLILVGRGRAHLLLNDGSGFFRDASSDWRRQVPGTALALRALYAASGTAVFAVGDGGAIRFNNGSGWSGQSSGTTSNLAGVHGTGASDVFSVGAGGTILHWNGSTWTSLTSGSTQPLNGVFAVTGTNIYVAGNQGTLLRSTNGITWSALTSGTTQHLRAAFAASATDVWVAGDGGTILYSSDGTTFAAQTSGTTRALRALWGSSATDVTAVGDGGTILHWNGTSWAMQASGSGADLFAVTGTSSTSLWATGRGGEVLVGNGTTWTPDDAGVHADLVAVAAPSATDVYAVGPFATIVHDDGSATTTGMPAVSLQARGAVALDTDQDSDLDLVVSGEGPDRVFVNNGTALFTDATGTAFPSPLSDPSWGLVAANLNGGTIPDLVVANDGQNRLWIGATGGTFSDGTDVAGSLTTGLPVHLDARDAAVGDVTGDGVPDVVLAIFGAQNRLFVPGPGGRYVDGTFAATTGLPTDSDPSEGATLSDVDADGDLDLLFANRGVQNRLYLNNGSGLFTDATAARLPTDTDPTVDIASGDVDGDLDRDLVMGNDGAQCRLYLNNGSGVFTDATGTRLPTLVAPTRDVALVDVNGDGDRDLLLANGGIWTQDTQAVTTNDLLAVSSAGASAVWAVGLSGTILFHNGTLWAAQTSGTTNALRGVYAVSTIDAFAVGDGGTILRWNGTSWSAMTSGTTNNLRAVFGSAANDVHAVGDSGTVLTFNGTSWSSTAPPGLTTNLTGGSSVSALSALAVGAGGTALAWNGLYWATARSGTATALSAAAPVVPTDFLVVGSAGLAIRVDPLLWTPVPSSTTNNLNAAAATGTNDVVAVGDAGRVVRDVGSGFAVETTPVSTNLLGVVAISPAHVVAVGAGGVVIRWRGVQNRLWTNNSAGTFTDGTFLPPTGLPADFDPSMDLHAGDLDLDGDLDLLWANARAQNRLSINNGAGLFTDGTDPGGTLPSGLQPDADDSRAIVILDANGGALDYVLGNHKQQNRLYFNVNGAGELMDRTDEGDSLPFGLPVDRAETRSIRQGDLNLDGLLDLVFVNNGGAVLMLHR